MRCLTGVVLVLGLGGTTPALAQRPAHRAEQSCAVCHGKENLEFEKSVHVRGGVTCISCHGGVEGALEVAEAHGPDLRRLSDPREKVESCGGCHSDVQRMRLFGLSTDQLSLYWTSEHGQKLAKDGDPRVATCASCHGSHFVLPVADSRSPVHKFNQIQTCGGCHGDAQLMGEHGVRSDVIELYRSSVHGQALIAQGHPAAPACANCHGSHGAAPPRFAESEMACGACHSVVQTYFDESIHMTGATATASVQCVSCHSNHDVTTPSSAMFLGDERGHCGSCHDDESDPALALARTLHDDVERLRTTIEDAEVAIQDAGGRGLFLGEERGYLDDARGLLVRARAMSHALSPDALDDMLNRGQAMVGQTKESLDKKNREIRDRRIFTGILFGVSVAFAIVLLMYAYQISGRWKARKVASVGNEVRDGV